MANIMNFSSFHDLKPKLIHVFGQSSAEIIFVTKEDHVYLFGCLGFGHIRDTPELAEVPELRNKGIAKIAAGVSHVIALSESGLVYSWGVNSDGQLGIGSMSRSLKHFRSNKVPDYVYQRPKHLDELKETVVDICSGSVHSLALTDSGGVYAWGCNNYGQIGRAATASHMIPVKVNVMNESRIVAIACGYNHSLVLSDTGLVYIFGYNQLEEEYMAYRNNRESDNKTPKSVGIKCKVAKITCGPHHSLLLTEDSDVYAFGTNNYGQLGIGNKENFHIPMRVNDETNKYVDIASDIYNHISVAVSANGFCYVWGETHYGHFLTPKLTSFKSIQDVYAVYAKHKVTHQTVCFESKFAINRISARLDKSFNNPDYSDLKFKVDGKFIYVQKWFIKISCTYFESMFAENCWSECDKKEIEITQYSYDVYYSFLKYLYTEVVDIRAEKAIELLDLANAYLEDELKQKCALIIKTQITKENVCVLFASAVKWNSKDLEDYCFEFALKYLNDICVSDSFEQMDDISCRRLIKRAALIKAFKQYQF